MFCHRASMVQWRSNITVGININFFFLLTTLGIVK